MNLFLYAFLIDANSLLFFLDPKGFFARSEDHVKDENDDTNNNDYHNESINNNKSSSSSSDNTYDSFFDEWKVGNWCWERDYNKYPVVVSVSLPANNNVNTVNGRTRADLKNTTKGGDDDDDNNDDGFFDDWVKGNWCYLPSKHGNNNNGDADADNIDTSRQLCHRKPIKTTRSRKKKPQNNGRMNDESIRKRKRSCEDDDDDDEEDFLPADDTARVVSAIEADSVDTSRQVRHRKTIKTTRSTMEEPRRCCTQNDNRYDQIWMGMFDKLVAYKDQHRNTMVPQRYDIDPKLGLWVNVQRMIYRKNELNPNRVDLLKSIGFDWNGLKCKAATDQLIWMNMFQKLVTYKKQHNSTKVPQKYDEDPKFGLWVSKQRRHYKHDKLLPSRYALLNSMNFI
ncbi:hypothetical protein FRACYDRAFT_235184 [Fragilariopsis cylindrus CCMP1102]|uniref:Helicase-associated domain-containing protein n=1 Tax=Fragilariopsis cylindrus CCMP1102 TaxID=635003 RepID=A0A1E7FTR2_9STRA|nr:hypothetical protein FRACYDRAFT_235184 [Fragilariopsis cylindrus CCMP1102]|eukprot:OEU21560.1 hypothetical protein FRACYDRAFT_235184 [Fragilariopsis cylindrus CCMP1102]